MSAQADAINPASPVGELQPPAAAASIKRESHRKSALKAVSWRVIGTIDTMLWAFIITGHWKVTLAIGGAEALSKVALYYVHERAWARFA